LKHPFNGIDIIQGSAPAGHTLVNPNNVPISKTPGSNPQKSSFSDDENE
jgi:hypothetical protein